MTIQRNKNSNHFCGPAAIALLTGVHVDDAARALRLVTGKRAVKGVINRHMMEALLMLGYLALPVSTIATAGKRPTLARLLDTALRDRKLEETFLVVITGHYTVIRGRRLYDNKHPEGIWLSMCPYRQKRVKAVFAVSKHGASTLPPRPMTAAEFTRELGRLGLSTDGSFVEAPEHYQFGPNGTHCLAITGTYEEMLAQVREELPLEACPADCDCREDIWPVDCERPEEAK